MNNVLRHHNNKFILIGKIKGLAGESKRARQRLIKAKVETAANALAYRKRVVGIDIRHHLLAYAFLRGTPYAKLEKNCREKPLAHAILQVVEGHIPLWIPYDPATSSGGWLKPVTIDHIEQWLAVKDL